MAKKTKQKAATKSTKKATKKKVTKKATKATKAKAVRPTKTKPTKTKTAKARPAKPKSVDSILQKYEKQRVSCNSKLTSIRAKIEDLQAKTKAYAEQINKLTEQELVTESVIAELDSKRDSEVSELLTKLGVNLDRVTSQPAKNESKSIQTEVMSQASGSDSQSDTDSDSKSDAGSQDDNDDG
jgi:chromosome segregation ATPase